MTSRAYYNGKKNKKKIGKKEKKKKSKTVLLSKKFVYIELVTILLRLGYLEIVI